jgi:hypothetical protein
MCDINSWLSGPSSKPLKRDASKSLPTGLKKKALPTGLNSTKATSPKVAVVLAEKTSVAPSKKTLALTPAPDLRTLIKGTKKKTPVVAPPEVNKTLSCDDEWVPSIFLRGTFVVENTFQPHRTASACKASAWELKKIVRVRAFKKKSLEIIAVVVF